jgi:hypothetical protein
MMARTEIKIAEQLYPKQVENFAGPEDLRRFLIGVIETVLYEKQSDIITRFIPGRNPQELQFMRWGEGSLGGKARASDSCAICSPGSKSVDCFPTWRSRSRRR